MFAHEIGSILLVAYHEFLEIIRTHEYTVSSLRGGLVLIASSSDLNTW
jgi:hypothetical protein